MDYDIILNVHKERLKKLERYISLIEYLDKALKDIVMRVCMLENRTIDPQQAITNLEYKNTKKPHKCPICKGEGYLTFYIPKHIDCKSCEGKGFVWG